MTALAIIAFIVSAAAIAGVDIAEMKDAVK